MSKYHAIRTTIDGITFASKAEAHRYLVLLDKVGYGEIVGLKLQPKFVIWQHGKEKITYIGDFQYVEEGRTVVEDVKGVETPVFRLKEKMFRAAYPDIELKIVGKDDDTRDTREIDNMRDIQKRLRRKDGE